jgi:hypothetical protein
MGASQAKGRVLMAEGWNSDGLLAVLSETILALSRTLSPDPLPF